MKTITTLAFLALSLMAFSQEETEPTFKTHTIGLFIGGASPSGDYADDASTNFNAGFAEGGLALGLNYQYRWDEHFAATVEYAGVAHSFNATSYAILINSGTAGSGISTSVSADPYSYGYLAFGVKGIIGSKFQCYINPKIGFSSLISPEVVIVSTNGSSSVTQRIRETDPAGAGMLGVGFGGVVVVSELISISLDFDYLQSTHEYDIELETFDANGNPTVNTSLVETEFRTFNTSIGLNFNF